MPVCMNIISNTGILNTVSKLSICMQYKLSSRPLSVLKMVEYRIVRKPYLFFSLVNFIALTIQNLIFQEKLAQSLFDHIPVGVGSKGIIPMTAKDLEEALEMGMDWSLREGNLNAFSFILLFPL